MIVVMINPFIMNQTEFHDWEEDSQCVHIHVFYESSLIVSIEHEKINENQSIKKS